MGIDKFNHEGYEDPTTYEALTNIHREEVVADKKAAYLPLVYVCSPYAGDIENNVKTRLMQKNWERLPICSTGTEGRLHRWESPFLRLCMMILWKCVSL